MPIDWSDVDRIKYDFEVHGELCKMIDHRIGPPLDIDWRQYVQDKDGIKMIPVSLVEELMVENDELRETLYTRTAEAESLAYRKVQAHMSKSTSTIVKIIQSIVDNSCEAITAKQVYQFCYHTLEECFDVSFVDKPMGVSKLHYVWQIGMLPIMSLILQSYSNVIQIMDSSARKEFETWAIKSEEWGGPTEVDVNRPDLPF